MTPRTNPGTHSGERGGALVISLIAVTSLTILSAALLQVSNRVAREQASGIDDLRALYLAEAGLSEAYNALVQGKDGNVGTAALPATFAGGIYWVEAEGFGDGLVALSSTGLQGSGRRSLEVVVRVQDQTMASLGAFGDEDVVLEDGATIDWYDSEEGTYAEQAGSGVSATVGSNGSIVLGDGAAVLGDVTPGAGCTVDLGSGATVGGSTAPAAEGVPFANLVAPEVGESLGELAVSSTQSLAPGAAQYDSLAVGAGATLTLSGPLDLVVGSLSLATGATLVFDTEQGPVTVYVLGDALLAAGSTLSDTQSDPTLAALYLLGDNVTPVAESEEGSGTEGASAATGHVGLLGGAFLMAQRGAPAPAPPPAPVGGSPPEWTNQWEDLGWVAPGAGDEPANSIEVAAQGTWHGFIYAPEAELSLPSSLHVLGGAVARRVRLESGATLTLDERLLQGAAADDFEYEILSWMVDALPSSPLVKQRDPQAYLANLGVVPVPSANAHAQQSFKIAYVDWLGARRSFLGVEEQFDWSVVAAVAFVQRDGVLSDPWPLVGAATVVPNSEKMTAGRGSWWGSVDGR